MAIPDFQSVMRPLLEVYADGAERPSSTVMDYLARHFGLTDDERQQLLPSGRQPVFANRVGWARTYLVRSGLLDATRRSFARITDRGREALTLAPTRIDIPFLDRYPEFVEFRTSSRPERTTGGDAGTRAVSPAAVPVVTTPEEDLENSYAEFRNQLAAELLTRTKSCTPEFFERLVVDLLVRMGYGGSLKDAGQAIGRSGDGGIDGIIKEDRLGLDVIYVQAKRWDGVVGRPEIHKFVGALHGQRARKGVFITTARFTADAVEYVRGIDTKIALIDGSTLSQLMIDHDLGVSRMAVYEVKRVDSDFFAEA